MAKFLDDLQENQMRTYSFFTGIAAVMLASPVFAKDIEVETDLGEKYIIKESAVKITLVTSNQTIAAKYYSRLFNLRKGVLRIENRMKQSNSDYQRCLQSGAFPKSHCDYTMSSDFLVDEQDRLDYVQKNIEMVEGEMNNEIKRSGSRPMAVLARYRPIFVDLNGLKKGLGYRKIKCIAPGAVNDMSKEIFQVYSDYKISTPSDIALEHAEWKLCQKLTKSLERLL